MRSTKSECLDRMIFFGEDSLRRAVREYLVNYHAERNHHGALGVAGSVDACGLGEGHASAIGGGEAGLERATSR